MCTPVGHALSGYTVCAGLCRPGDCGWKLVILTIVAANLSDIDYVLGLAVGRPNAFHHGFTHSFAFALLAGLGLGRIGRHTGLGSFRFLSTLFIGAGFSHLLLDFFTTDTAPPFGEQLFWPFSGVHFLSPAAVFRDIHKGSTNETFFRSLFLKHNWITVLTELAVFVPMALAGRLLAARRRRRNPNEG